MKPTILALLLALASTSAQAQFRARDVRGADEATIYNSRELRRLDRELNSSYEIAKSRALRRGRYAYVRLVDEQRSWLRRRSRCGMNKDCLVAMYERRINELD
jgi:uncharacterized protein